MQVPKLRQWREYRALTQVELAEKAGTSERSVASYEGGAGARPATVRKLAAALDVDVSALLEAPDAPKAPAPHSPDPPEGASGEERRALRYLQALANLGTRLEDRVLGYLDRAGPDPPWSRLLSSTEHYAGIVDYARALAEAGVWRAPTDGPLAEDEESLIGDILATSRRLDEAADRLGIFADRAELEVRRDNRDSWKEEKREAALERRQELLRDYEAAREKADAG